MALPHCSGSLGEVIEFVRGKAEVSVYCNLLPPRQKFGMEGFSTCYEQTNPESRFPPFWSSHSEFRQFTRNFHQLKLDNLGIGSTDFHSVFRDGFSSKRYLVETALFTQKNLGPPEITAASCEHSLPIRSPRNLDAA